MNTPTAAPLSDDVSEDNNGFAIVAFAASAGGLRALIEVLSHLPTEFPTGIVVVQHLDPRHQSLMAEILDRRTPLTVKEATHGEPIRRCLIDQIDREELTLAAINRRGRTIQCRISFNPLIGFDQNRQGVILLMEEFEP